MKLNLPEILCAVALTVGAAPALFDGGRRPLFGKIPGEVGGRDTPLGRWCALYLSLARPHLHRALCLCHGRSGRYPARRGARAREAGAEHLGIFLWRRRRPYAHLYRCGDDISPVVPCRLLLHAGGKPCVATLVGAVSQAADCHVVARRAHGWPLFTKTIFT